MRPGIDTINEALIALLQVATDLDDIPDNQIQDWSNSFDPDTMEIIVAPPAVLVAYDGGQYSAANNDNSAYRIDERFTLIAVAENLRGSAESRAGVYEILEALKAVIVGSRRMTLDNVTNKRVSLVLLGTVLFENLFYKNGCAAIGLQIQATGTSWDYADA